MNPNGPYVSVAALCDFVLHEKDERLSCIRFLDTVNLEIPADAPDPFPPITIQINGLITLKSGGFVGAKTLKVTLRTPSGKVGKKPTQTFPAEFKGNEHGFNLILKIGAQIAGGGLYYFDISLDDEMVTCIPLRINITRMKPPETEPPS